MSTLRLISHNVNGIRAALRRGLHDLWEREQADVICLQEVRCQVKDLPDGAFTDHHVAWSVGKLAGRNGVAILTRRAPERIATLDGGAVIIAPGGNPADFEAERVGNRDLAPFAGEGRYVEVDLADAPIRVASLYLPKGAVPKHHARRPEEADTPKYERKMRFMAGLARYLTQARRSAAQAGREYVITGDFNIANTELDLKNWRANQRTDGFLPEEREWFTAQLSPRTLVDVIRSAYPGQDGPYSWWSWRGQAFANDSGWRIDYHLATPKLAKAAVRAESLREADYDSRVSDHCPVAVDYDPTRLS